MLKFRICLNFPSLPVKVFREVLDRSWIVFRFVYAIKSPAFCPRVMRTLKKYLHWTSSSGNAKPLLLVFPCRRTRLYLHRSSEAEGGPMWPNWICNIISLRPHITIVNFWRRLAKRPLRLFHSAPSERRDIYYTRPCIFYLWFRDIQADDENRAHGGPAP